MAGIAQKERKPSRRCHKAPQQEKISKSGMASRTHRENTSSGKWQKKSNRKEPPRADYKKNSKGNDPFRKKAEETKNNPPKTMNLKNVNRARTLQASCNKNSNEKYSFRKMAEGTKNNSGKTKNLTSVNQARPKDKRFRCFCKLA